VDNVWTLIGRVAKLAAELRKCSCAPIARKNF
jgi:hypothetical protein